MAIGIPVSVPAPGYLNRFELVSCPWDLTRNKVDDYVVYEIKVENTGHEQLMIPWDPNPSHMEPKGRGNAIQVDNREEHRVWVESRG